MRTITSPVQVRLMAVGCCLFSSTTWAAAAPTGNPSAMRDTNGFRIIVDNQPQAVIVIPDKPYPVIQYAVQELQTYLEQASGTRLEVRAESTVSLADKQNYIYVGPCRAAANAGLDVSTLPKNGFLRRGTDNALFFIGKDDEGIVPPRSDSGSMGTLFAVYDWLEDQLRVRWLWPGDSGAVVPPAKEVLSGENGTQSTSPQLIHSRLRLNAWPGGMGPEQRKKYIEENHVWLRRQRFARGTDLDYGHAYTNYWERFGATHPEYFARRSDGVRAPFDPKRPNLVQMCVSNPALHQQIIADWLVQRRQKPVHPWINGIENDKTASDPACTCPNCLAWDAKGSTSFSDRYAKYWLALQEEGKKVDPNATVIGYAYADYSTPPLETKLNSNIIVGIVPRYSFPLSEADKNDFRATWEGWKKTGARLYLRPNYTLPGYSMPYIFPHQLGEEFKFSSANGMVATDFDSLTGMWGVQGVNTYVLARLHIDANQDIDAVLDEYYAGFGPAAGHIKAYIAYWEKVTQLCTEDFRKRTQGGWGFLSKGGDEIYTPSTFQTGAALLAEAKIAAQADPAASKRIEFLEVWLEHARLSAQALSAFHAQQKQPGNGDLKTAFTQAKTAVDEFRKQHQEVIGNTGLLRQLEVWSGWRKPVELTE